MARRTPIEYTTENPAYEEGRKTWKWFIGFIVAIVILKVLS